VCTIPHTAYSAAKFAVKGFTEALIEDFRVNAPHVKVAVVMPGHVGTDIVLNSRELLGVDLEEARTQMARRGLPTDGLSDDDIQNMMRMFGEMFRDSAPVTAAQAATTILDGVRAGKWRILIGDDAVALDEAVRADPEGAYGENGLSLDSITGR
jgi:NAD(P)-dependent dehydrogenase (short-subunit alcohol dehydrogenase family)